MRFFIIGLFVFCLIGCRTVNNSIAEKTANSKIIGDPNDNLRYDSAGKITSEQLTYLRDNYDWNTGDILIINYTLPENSCTITYPKPVEPEARFKRARTWWDPFYESIETYDSRTLHLEASERYATWFSRYSKQYYWDKDGYVIEKLFRNASGCEAVFVVNRLGQFYQQNEHYTVEQVAFYVAKLKNSLSDTFVKK